MSPLARSLLALAALLAAADAEGEYNCVPKTIGVKTDNLVDLAKVVIPYPEGWIGVDPDDSNCPYPTHHVGETITVCNRTPYARAPEIDDTDTSVTPVHIKCFDTRGCVARTTEYCG